jgi:multiple sugar transport system permease protein
MNNSIVTSKAKAEERLSARPGAKNLAALLKKVVLYLALIILAATMVVPFLWMLSTSLKSNQFVLSFPPQLIPRPITIESYTRLFELYPMARMFGNSLLAAVLTTMGQLITCSMAAYAFARMQFRGREVLFLLYLATLMVPFQVTITPLFILMRIFGWINTYQGLILPGVFSAFGTFLLRQHLLTIPKELEEAAFLDGASHWMVFRRIILPLATPALATLAVFAFMGSWNSFLWPLFVLNDLELMTLPVGLATLHGRWLTEWNLVMAGTVITTVPMILVYLFAQQYLVKGFVTSGLKG